MKKRIVFLHRYDRSTASFRARCECYFENLRQEDYEIVTQSLFSEAYLTAPSSSLQKAVMVLASYLRRLLFLFSLRRTDLIILYVELFPFWPATVERVLHAIGFRWIYDIDDPFFHNYDDHRLKSVRRLFAGKIGKIISLSELVIVGNAYLEAYAKQFHSRIKIIPSVIDLNRFSETSAFGRNHITVGWIGTPATTKYLKIVEEGLRLCGNKKSFRLLLIGGANPFSKDLPPSIHIEERAWNEAREILDIAEMDIGIMPLPDNPFTRGKGGMKIMLYMGSLIPSIASPIGFNCEIIQHEKNGLLATTPAEWADCLIRCIENEELRKSLGAAGRKTVEAHYCIQVTRPLFLQTIRSMNAASL